MLPKKLMSLETLSLAVSFGIATFFYKFGSFALECSAFLVTWYAVTEALRLAARLAPARARAAIEP